MIALVHLSPSASIKARKMFRLQLFSRSRLCGLNITTLCSIVSDAVACLATSMRVGAERKVLVIRSISVAIVALKNKVCLVKGVSPKIRSMSGIKPISSILSASSTTMT